MTLKEKHKKIHFFHKILRIFVIVVHALQLFIWNECNYPLVYPIVVVLNAPFFLALTVADHLMRDRRKLRTKEIVQNIITWKSSAE